jgi:very-short-patch-repair endonuclease
MGREMTKKTLTVLPLSERTEAPALQKRGRGWNIAESRLDTIHEMARAQKREPTAAQVLLGEKLIAAELGKYKLNRQVVIGSAIVDFACQPLKVAVLIDEGGDEAVTRRRDKSLEAVGIQLLRFPAADVLADPDMVVASIVAALKARYLERGSARRQHQQPRSYGR